MQHSPQEIKTRLDKAVDPEGNVLDMVAVLELVTTLERLPLTREALETTRIGKTINLLRKKTNNDDLAKRAKKLVKKWQKLVITQIEASRTIDSPLNGSRISSPQINGTIHDNKSTPLKGKKGVKRKHSTSSLSNSPLTLTQETMSPCATSDNSSCPSSPFPLMTELHGSALKQTSLCSESKKPKLMDDHQSKNGASLVHSEELQPRKSPILECDDKNNVNKTQLSSNKDVHTIINTTAADASSKENNLTTESICTDSGFDSLDSNVNTCSSQHSSNQEVEKTQSNSQPDFENKIECKENHLNDLLVKNGTSQANCEMIGKSNDGTDSRLTDGEILSQNLQTSEQMTEEEPCFGAVESEVSEKLETSKPFEPDNTDSEKMDIKPTEPKEHILDLNQQANGINGRYNDQGVWYPWTDVMPYNDGNLNILPYVILD